MENKLKVMVHYTRYGVLRSPNTQADFIRTNEYLAQKCDMVILDQKELPHEIGHIKSIKLLKEKIKAEKPDIVHIIGVKEGFHCAVAAFLAGCKKRVLITHGFAGYSNVIKQPQRFIYRWIIEPLTLLLSTYVQCNSKFSYDQQMIRMFAKNKRAVIYNFIEKYKYSSEHIWRQEKGINEDDFLVATIGNMHSGKGYDILTDIIKRFNNNEKVKFVIMGDGPLKQSFDESVKEEISKGKVYSLGNVPHDRAMQILSESNLFVLPTRYETLGMVFAEAALCKVPSVGTKVGAVGELVKDSETGYLVDMDDTEKMIERIKYLLDNPLLCKEMGERAQVYAGEVFSSQKSAEKIFEIYKR